MFCTDILKDAAIETDSLFELCRTRSGRKSTIKEIDCYDTLWVLFGFSENVRYIVANGNTYSTGE